MKVKIKKTHKDAVIPRYSKDGDAGMDLTAVSVTGTEKYIEYSTGLAFEIPKGYVGMIYPRSSVTNTDMMLKNCVGIIDSGFRGVVTARFAKTRNGMDCYKVGDRVAQIIIMPYPEIEFEESDSLEETERGDGGYGSSGQ